MKEIFSSQAYKIMEISFEKCKRMPMHHSSTDAFIIVNKGTAELKLGDEIIGLGQGATQLIPAYIPHELTITSDFSAHIILEKKSVIKYLPVKIKKDLSDGSP